MYDVVCVYVLNVNALCMSATYLRSNSSKKNYRYKRTTQTITITMITDHFHFELRPLPLPKPLPNPTKPASTLYIHTYIHYTRIESIRDYILHDVCMHVYIECKCAMYVCLQPTYERNSSKKNYRYKRTPSPGPGPLYPWGPHTGNLFLRTNPSS